MKKLLRNIPLLVSINHGWSAFLRKVRPAVSRTLHKSRLKRIHDLALYAPNTAGYFEGLESQIENLTFLSARQVFPFLLVLSQKLNQPTASVIPAEDFCEKFSATKEAHAFKQVFDAFGCDKTLSHNYHTIYGAVLKDLGQVSSMLEIGLGTTHTDVVSNMGRNHIPGNSLRAFRAYLPTATIYGADIDKRILFNEERIETHFVDQTDLRTFSCLQTKIPGQLDLVIDDGLHAPSANLSTLIFGIEKVRVGGWIVIEDISEEALPFWQVVSCMLCRDHECFLIRAYGGLVLALQKSAPA